MKIYHQSRKGKISYNKLKKQKLIQKGCYCEKTKKELPIEMLTPDHDFPISMGGNDKIENIKLLSKIEHKKKSGIDRIILNLMIKNNMIDRPTSFYTELLVPINKIKEFYFKKRLELGWIY